MTRLRDAMQPIGGQLDGQTRSGYVFVEPGGDRWIVTTGKEMFEPECGCLVLVGMILGSQEPWLGFDACDAHREQVRKVYARYQESLSPEGKAMYDGRTALDVAVEMYLDEIGGTDA